MKTTKACPSCGKTFTRIHTSYVVPKFCSHSCSRRGKVTPEETRAKIRASAPRGAAHSQYKGGTWVIDKGKSGLRAYVTIDGEMQRRLGLKRAFMPRARFVWMQAHPGELLTRTDIIHHVNGDSLDDRPENLVRLQSQSAHATLHDKVGEINATRTRLPDTPCETCGGPKRPWRRFCSVPCTAAGLSGKGNPNAGKSMPVEQREKIAAAKRGRKLSDETRAKMSAAHLQRAAAERAKRQP